MSRRIEITQDTVSMSPAVADKLIQRGSGDAALLYIYLIRHDGYCEAPEAMHKLQWTQLQLDSAFVHLRELGLCGEIQQAPLQQEEPSQDNAPDYTDMEIAQEIQQQSAFKAVLDDTEQQLGRKLNTRDMRVMLELYDHAGLPAEVLMMLVTWQVQETDRRHPGRKPTISAIRTAAYRWKNGGIDTADAVEAYLKKLDYYRSQEGRLLETVGIVGRPAAAGEKQYLNEWIDKQYPLELVALAYDRTITSIGSMKWPYCSAILRRWNDSGFHSVAEVEKGERHRRKTAGAAAQKVPMAPAPTAALSPEQSAAQIQQQTENAYRLRAFLERQKQEESQ